MLIEFTVRNFRSIKEDVTLSMLATKEKEHEDHVFYSEKEPNIGLLRSAAIYGANASGKSNVINALRIFHRFIDASTDMRTEEGIWPHIYNPHKLDQTWQTAPTMFEMEFLGPKSIRYRYSIEFNAVEILAESLVFYPNRREANLFCREKGQSIKFGGHLRGDKAIIENQLIENNLFLTKAANSNHKMLKEIYLHIKQQFLPGFYDPFIHNQSSYTTMQILENDSKITKEMVENLLKIADIGIKSIAFRKEDERIFGGEQKGEDEVLRTFIRRIGSARVYMERSLYQNEKEVGVAKFELEEESDGTYSFYSLIGRILNVLIDGGVLIVDEPDNSLHPLLVIEIVKMFNNPETNSKNAQIIFATHDTSLLSRENFRRDQIWFTEKDRYGATNLYSLAEFKWPKIHNKAPFEKWYLTGRFGAIPLFGDFAEWKKDGTEKA